MKKLNLTVKQQQHATGNLLASIVGAVTDSEAIAREFSSRLATLYGRAPKTHTQKAKADGHTDSFAVDWTAISFTIGTPQQTLSEVESGLLRSFCDANKLTLLGVSTVDASNLHEAWAQDVKLWKAIAEQARLRWKAEAEEKAKADKATPPAPPAE